MKKTLAALLLVGSLAFGAQAHAALIFLNANLSGANEVPAGSGDPDGTGFATLVIDTGDGTGVPTVRWQFNVSNIGDVILAHIHRAPAGTNGPVIVDFDARLNGSGLADADLTAVIANPAGFYINIHTTEFRSGAIRGQLQVPEPGTLALMALGLCALLFARRRRLLALPAAY